MPVPELPELPMFVRPGPISGNSGNSGTARDVGQRLADPRHCAIKKPVMSRVPGAQARVRPVRFRSFRFVSARRRRTLLAQGPAPLAVRKVRLRYPHTPPAPGGRPAAPLAGWVALRLDTH